MPLNQLCMYYLYSAGYFIHWASLIAQLVKNMPAMQKTQFNSWVRKIHWRRDRLPTQYSWALLWLSW